MRLPLILYFREAILLFAIIPLVAISCCQKVDGLQCINYVMPLITTLKNSHIFSIAVTPFGVVQVGLDTNQYGDGYR